MHLKICLLLLGITPLMLGCDMQRAVDAAREVRHRHIDVRVDALPERKPGWSRWHLTLQVSKPERFSVIHRAAQTAGQARCESGALSQTNLANARDHFFDRLVVEQSGTRIQPGESLAFKTECIGSLPGEYTIPDNASDLDLAMAWRDQVRTVDTFVYSDRPPFDHATANKFETFEQSSARFLRMAMHACPDSKLQIEEVRVGVPAQHAKPREMLSQSRLHIDFAYRCTIDRQRASESQARDSTDTHVLFDENASE